MLKKFIDMDEKVLSFEMDEEYFYVLIDKKIRKYSRNDLSIDLDIDFFKII